MATESPSIDPDVPPRARLVGLLTWLWANALEEQAVWRLIVGEAVRGEEAATRAAAEVVDLLGTSLEAWLTTSFADIPGDPSALARVIRGQMFALVVEHLALGGVTTKVARERAEELAAILVPSG